ncbi:HlyD family efflux transporter periplasmic adaptor subunit [Paenibacillus sp. HWE-109]|uniref:HlyD family efflux transporter periplasmic adaptor subunit n=1 Tax=Paenibacillus sp. HWE-109 TaxID=1306526 RepID=UPI001EDD1D64|nr:HlyD family efflux transporter periplasmic adaptor subunit [Paenibacillus sp. HWE-109]UKS29707.1 HlyD family efflux transporter periplasmic adaptor subunit [Paenibacillus sp. HWE-109]
MNFKAGIYIGIAIVVIAGGALLAAKGKDAVSQAESRKQGVLEAEQNMVVFDKSKGIIVKINAAAGDSVKQGDILFKVKTAEGADMDILSPNDGLISKIMVKPGDQLAQGMPIAVVQKTSYYADLYVQEGQIQKLDVNKSIQVHFPYLKRFAQVDGVVASISAAPQFASLRMTRERGQADLSMYLVRITVNSNSDLLPGMTAEVDLDEIVD